MPRESRKRNNNSEDSPVYVQETAQENFNGKTDVNVWEKLDKEYPEWREEQCQNQKVYMVPCVFSDAGTKNAANGKKAERVLFKLLENSEKPSGIREYFKPVSGKSNTISGFVFHGQKYEGTEVDFVHIDMTGVTIYECKGITSVKQAQGKYETACGQIAESVPKLDLDDEIPINRVVAFPLCKRTKISENGNIRPLFKEDCENTQSFCNWLSQSYSRKYFSEKKLSHGDYVKVVKKFLLTYHQGGNFCEFKRRVLSGPADGLERETRKFYTKEQAEVLNAGCFQDMWVEGSAGSGKTFLLKERVVWLARLYHDKKSEKLILVVTYNRAIGEEIK